MGTKEREEHGGFRNGRSATLPATYEACAELSRGLTRVGTNRANFERGMRTVFISESLVPLLAAVFFILAVVELSGLDGRFLPDSFWLVILALGTLDLSFLFHRSATFNLYMGLLNKLYEKADSLVDPYRIEGERILASLYIREHRKAFLLRAITDHGICFLTTHRCIAFMTRSDLAGFEKAILDPDSRHMIEWDYSSSANFRPKDSNRAFPVYTPSERFIVRPYGSESSKVWEVMVVDSPDFNILEILLARRYKVEVQAQIPTPAPLNPRVSSQKR